MPLALSHQKFNERNKLIDVAIDEYANAYAVMEAVIYNNRRRENPRT